MGKDNPRNRTAEQEQGRDRLTGVWNREEMEARTSGMLREGGALFLCDICRLGQINHRLGHRAGDECLRQTARVLGFLIREGDVLGRVGGDEFAVFVPGCREGAAVESIRKRIRDRFAAERRKGSDKTPFSVAVGAAVCREGDTLRSLVERAGEELARAGEDSRTKNGDGYQRDARRIREELMEEIRVPGAYCRDYETFRSIYRFLERGILRGGQKGCVILLSVADREGNSIRPDQKDLLMERLGEDIRATLRLGDVYTRYTSSQYLMLAIDTTEDFADGIVERIRQRFLAGGGDSSLLVHYCYQLRPAQVRGMQGYA